jgi:hypothetical protein
LTAAPDNRALVPAVVVRDLVRAHAQALARIEERFDKSEAVASTVRRITHRHTDRVRRKKRIAQGASVCVAVVAGLLALVKAISELRIEIKGGPRSDTLLVVMLTLLAVGVAVWAAVLAFQAQALEQIGMSRLTFWSAPSRRSRQYPPRRTWSRGDGHRLRNSKNPFQKAEVTPAGFGAAPGGAACVGRSVYAPNAFRDVPNEVPNRAAHDRTRHRKLRVRGLPSLQNRPHALEHAVARLAVATPGLPAAKAWPVTAPPAMRLSSQPDEQGSRIHPAAFG